MTQRLHVDTAVIFVGGKALTKKHCFSQNNTGAPSPTGSAFGTARQAATEDFEAVHEHAEIHRFCGSLAGGTSSQYPHLGKSDLNGSS